MTRWTIILALDEAGEARQRWLDRANSLGVPGSAVEVSQAALVHADKKGTGDLVWSLVLPTGVGVWDASDIAGLLDAEQNPVRICECVPVEPLASRTIEFEGPRVLRTLFIKVRPGSPEVEVSRLEASLAAMPDHIASIRSWALSRISPAATPGDWTHLWEQEFAEARGFRPYMAHPYHWTGVERWFDPEIPGFIVLDEAHYLSDATAPVLAVS